ncbi:unnamed protein product [Cylindrotheca closterium]|uniref:Uncharacterized protein n=1 Tax=Cylindrotheca closterium TaxID=2856 RepID=A0AAD2CG79_9STRA|nr:unnamed protein product [Cylindrotheca closterium]
MSQRLNNTAAHQIESGDYDKAIKTLNNALRLSRADFRQSQTSHLFMLEACLSYSQNLSTQQAAAVGEGDENSSNNSNSSNKNGLVIYQQALRVPSEYMSHPMGRILPLLVMYNMALANQLKSLKETNDDKQRRVLLNRALKLYELAYQWQSKEEHKSLRLNMILVNNIGDIHRRVNNKTKFQRCMQQLMRTLLYVRVTDGENIQQIQPMETTFRRNIQMSSSAGAA